MSANPLLPTEPTGTPADAQAVIDALGDQAGAVAAATLLANAANMPSNFPDPPKGTMSYSEELVRQTFYKTWWALVDLGAWRWLATVVAYFHAGFVGVVTITVGVISWAIKVVGIDLLEVGLGQIDQFRKALDPQVAAVSVSVLNELLGTDFAPFGISTAPNLQGHIDRSEEVGAMFHQQLIDQYKPANQGDAFPSATAAERFTGQIINFGTATALLGLTGELATVGIIKDFRLIGEQVSSGLGLTRLHRLAMRPLMTTLVAQPYQWYLNLLFHPTQFKASELVNAFTQTVMDEKTMFHALNLEGYSDEKIEKLIKLHQKKLTIADVALLERWKLWDLQTSLNYIVSLGYDPSIAGQVLNIADLHRVDARITTLIGKLESAVDAGHLPADDAMAIIEKLPINGGEIEIIRQSMMTFAKTPHKSLTLTEIEKAFEDGIFTVDDVVARLQLAGWQGDDLQTLTTLVLLKFAKDVEAKAVAQFAWEQKVGKAKAKGLPVPPKPAILA